MKPIKIRSPRELTPKQKRTLQEQFRFLSDKELARMLNTDKASVRAVMDELGLKREGAAPSADVPFRSHWIAFLFLFFSVALSYGHTLNYSFHFDDLKTFVETPTTHIKALSRESLSPILHGNRPVANLTYALNFYFDRLEPRGYHLFNILIHFGASLILYLLFLKTLSLPGIQKTLSTDLGGNTAWLDHREKVALVGALLWAVHPVQTQAVTYVVQRMASLAAFFYLLSLLSYIYGRTARGNRSYLWFGLSVLTAFMAFGSKENALTLPLIIFLYDLFFITRFNLKISRAQLMLILGLSGILLLGIGWAVSLYGSSDGLSGMLTAQYGTEEMDSLLRVMTEWRVIILYLTLLAFPYPGRMNLDYDFAWSKSLFDPVTTFLSLLVLLALTGFALFKAKKVPLTAFSILWFLINLAMESSFIKLDLVFEHRLYLSSAIFFLVFAAGIYAVALRFQIRRQEVLIGGIVVLAGVLILMTHERNKVWKTSVSLWSDVALKSPNRSRVINNLGKAYLEEEKWDQAKENFARSIRLDPKNQEALNNLGNANQREGNLSEAVKNYEAVLALNSNNPLAHNDLGVAYQNLGRSDLALKGFLEAVRLDPYYTDAHNNLGNIYLLSNQLDLAAVEYQKTIELNPKHPMAHTNLGILYEKQGKLNEGLRELTLGLNLNPHSSIAQFNYAYLLELMGRKNEAIEHYEEAIKWAAPQDAAQMEMVKQHLKTLK
ncbi:MAG: tetratricopeptide repeat protein [Nitrospirae bacterium]|nr:tetratricopeptide repeat protein [Nitrospirota bacterium]